MSIISMLFVVIAAVCLASVGGLGISFFGAWAWDVIREIRQSMGHHSAHF